MIEELGPPDGYVENPLYQSGPSACLYLIDRVERWIEANRDRVEKARASRAKRSASATLAQERIRQKNWRRAFDWLNGQGIHLRPLPDDLREAASRRCQPRPDGNILKGKGIRAYVRHKLTNYDGLRRRLDEHGWHLQNRLYERLRGRVGAVVEEAVRHWATEHGLAVPRSGLPVCGVADVVAAESSDAPEQLPVGKICSRSLLSLGIGEDS